MALQTLDRLGSVGRSIIVGESPSKKSFSITPLKYNPTDGSLEIEIKKELFLDATVNQDESHAVSVTNYPLESGGSFAEHAQELALTISVTGIISDASLSYVDTVSSLQGSFLGQLVGAESKSQKAYTKLTTWSSAGQPLFVKTKYKKEGFWKLSGAQRIAIPFVIESINFTRNKDTGDALSFSMTLRQIRLISPKKDLVSFQKIAVPDKGSAGPNDSLKADEAQKNNKSLLDMIKERELKLRNKG